MVSVKRSVRMTRELHDECTEIFESLGLTTSAGISIFLYYVVREGGIKFKLPDNFEVRREKTINRKFNIDDDIFEKACNILEKQGYTLRQAVNLYLETVRRIGGVPFELMTQIKA